MGYDEPSSRRQAAIAVEPVRGQSSKARSVLLAVLLLGGGAYAAVYFGLVGDVTSYFGAPRNAGRTVTAPPVRIATADVKDVAVMVHTIGTVLANSVVNIKSQVDGPLLQAMFKEGQMVRKGDLLFRIEPAPFEAALRQSQATEMRDRAQLASAQADADRATMLADRGIVSTQQRDQLVANAKALSATVDADVAAVDRAKLNLGYTTIRSPINGKTGPLIAYPGNQVHANDVAGLVTITEIQPVKISFNLPQDNLPLLQDRMGESELIAEVTARSDAASAATEQKEMALPVKIDFIGNTVDARTGTIELRATSSNPDLRLVPGELVDVSVRLETLTNVTTVPREAVNVGQAGDYVFVVDAANKAQMRSVRVLYQEPALAALGAGVEKGERVIVDGQLRVTPGAAVSITEPQAPGAANVERTASGEK